MNRGKNRRAAYYNAPLKYIIDNFSYTPFVGTSPNALHNITNTDLGEPEGQMYNK